MHFQNIRCGLPITVNAMNSHLILRLGELDGISVFKYRYGSGDFRQRRFEQIPDGILISLSDSDSSSEKDNTVEYMVRPAIHSGRLQDATKRPYLPLPPSMVLRTLI